MSIGLILEGGGNRGAYTAGVLDVLAENDIYIQDTYAVSAGACNAVSYLSKQPKRNYRIYTEYADDKRYSSWKLLWKTGSLFGFDFIFGELTQTLLPFDYDEFHRTSMRLHIGTTDVRTGQPVFFTKETICPDDMRTLTASASLPVVANIVEYEGYELLDGGISEPIPLPAALKDGITKNIVVLTRDRGYVKKNKPDFPLFYLRRRYKAYPKLVEAMVQRASRYMQERTLCYQEQERENAIVIEPSRPITIKRQCRDTALLEEIYQLGVRDANNRLVEINRFLAMNR